MKLDRNINGDGRGKYGLIKSRRLAQIEAWDGGDGEVADRQAVIDAVELLERAGVIEWGEPKTPAEFFVIKLRDEHAEAALSGYAAHAMPFDQEYASDVFDLANRAGPNSHFCKEPD